MFLGRPENLHDASQLFLFILAGEDGITGIEFRQNTSDAPHIDGHAIRHAEDDFGRPVEARLNVGIHLFVFEATRAKVDDFDLRVHGMCQQNVFRLQIAVDDFMLLEQDQSLKQLFRKPSDQLQRESSEIVDLDEFIEVHA